MSNFQEAADALSKNGFEVKVFENSADAKKAIIDLVGNSSVGFGGSITINEMGIYDELLSKGNQVYWHWKVKPEQVPEAHKKAYDADYYLSSANGITQDGKIVNIDGKGNRVAATFMNSGVTIIVAGQNKICADYDAAVARCKKFSCGPNARRLNLATPCSVNDNCTDCDSPQRMCRIVVSLERPPMGGKKVLVYLVKEDLGY